MSCDEVAEFVSALCDGEAIPRSAAEHVNQCAGCQERLKKYMEMGAELRLMATLAMDERVAPRIWSGPRSLFAHWWQKGWERMRIPKLAFAILIAAIVGLGSTFAVVQVRARSNGTVVLLKIARPGGDPVDCALSTQDKNRATCALIGRMNGKMIGYQIDLIGRRGDGVELAVRTKTFGAPSGSFSLSTIRKEPQKQIYFEPGQTVRLDIAGSGTTLTVTGEWLDHMPVFLGSTQDFQAGPEELRLVSPLLISDRKVLGDLQGGSATSTKAGDGIEVYMPGDGRFIFSLSPMRGAVQARVMLNRISFEDSGRSYVFVTGSPVSRSEHLWVVHEAEFKPNAAEHFDAKNAFISSGNLHTLDPRVVMDGESAKK